MVSHSININGAHQITLRCCVNVYMARANTIIANLEFHFLKRNLI